jgi:hypothetical protein
MERDSTFVPGLAAAIKDGKLQPCDRSRKSVYPVDSYTSILDSLKGIRGKYRLSIEAGLVPERVKLIAIDELHKVALRAAALNNAEADYWKDQLEGLRTRFASERANSSKRLLDLQEAQLRIGAMGTVERAALIGEFLGGRGHLRSHEIDMLCSKMTGEEPVYVELRTRRAEYAKDPANEYPEAGPYRDLERQYREAGGSIECENTERPGETCFIKVEQLLDLGDPPTHRYDANRGGPVLVQ